MRYCDDIHDSYQIATKNQAPKNFISDLEYTIGIYCDTNNASYYYQRGIAYYNLTQYDKAVDIYTKGLAKKPSNSMLLSFRGNAYYIQKKYKEALADYTQSISNKENVIDDIKANQKHTEINLFDETYINGFISSMQVSMAESYFALQEYDKALEEINKGLAIAPNLKEFGKENFYNVRGTIHLALGNYNSALADFDTCILLNNAEPFLYVNRSIARTQQNKTTKIRSVSLSGGINNRTFYGNWLIPITKDKDKNTSNLLLALKDCNKAIEQDKNLAEAYYIKAIIEKQLGTGDYCSDLKKAQNLGYTIEAEWLKECR